VSVLCSASPESPHQDGQTIQKRCLTADWLTCHAGLDQTSNKKQSRRHLKEVLSWKSNPSDCFASLAMTRMRSLRGFPSLLIARLSLSRHCEGFPFSSLGGSLFVIARHFPFSHWGVPFSSSRGFPYLVIARHEVPKQSQVPIGHTMKALGRKEPASQSNPSDCFASLAMTRMRSLRGISLFLIGGFPFSSLRGISLFIIGGLPFRHCEALPPSSLRGTKCRSNLRFR